MDLNFSPIAILIAIGAASLVFFAAGAVRKRKTILMPDGTRQLAPSDLDKITTPLVRTLARLRGGNKARLSKQLQWARIPYFSAETWTVMTIFAGPALGLVMLMIFGSDLGSAVIPVIISVAIGLIYPRVYLNGKLGKRQKAIARDVVPFISQFARTAAIAKDTSTTFEVMNNLARAEDLQFQSRLKLPTASRKRLERARAQSPYASDLWLGLDVMMRNVKQGLYRADADYDRPDPLIEFAIFADDKDISRFIDKIRAARAQNSNISPANLDIEVDNLHALQQERIIQSYAKMLQEATFLLVAFNMPLLLIAAMAPAIGPLLGQLGEV